MVVWNTQSCCQDTVHSSSRRQAAGIVTTKQPRRSCRTADSWDNSAAGSSYVVRQRWSLGCCSV